VIIENVKLSSYTLDKIANNWVSCIVDKSHYEQVSLKRPRNFFGKYNPNSSDFSDIEFIEEAYFGGVLFGKYGHFLIEGLSFLPNIPDDNVPIFFLTLNDVFTKWQQEFFQDIGLLNRLVFSKKNKLTHIRRLHLFDQANVIDSLISFKYTKYLQSLFSNNKGSKFLYISRRKCRNAKIKNEDIFEKKLISLGIEIVCPEDFSIKNQVSLYESASIIIGIEGSALHTLLFCSTPKTLLIFRRREELAHNFHLQFATLPNINVIEKAIMVSYGKKPTDESEIDVDAAIESVCSLIKEHELNM